MRNYYMRVKRQMWGRKFIYFNAVGSFSEKKIERKKRLDTKGIPE